MMDHDTSLIEPVVQLKGVDRLIYEFVDDESLFSARTALCHMFVHVFHL
jgi:hypothetical protein